MGRQIDDGRGAGRRVMQAPTMAGAARVLVQIAPDALDEAATAIATIPGVEVCDRSKAGKLALLLRCGNAGNLAATLRKVSMVSGVMSATLAMQAEPTCGSVD